jgi:hypothetical protein
MSRLMRKQVRLVLVPKLPVIRLIGAYTQLGWFPRLRPVKRCPWRSPCKWCEKPLLLVVYEDLLGRFAAISLDGFGSTSESATVRRQVPTISTDRGVVFARAGGRWIAPGRYAQAHFDREQRFFPLSPRVYFLGWYFAFRCHRAHIIVM